MLRLVFVSCGCEELSGVAGELILGSVRLYCARALRRGTSESHASGRSDYMGLGKRGKREPSASDPERDKGSTEEGEAKLERSWCTHWHAVRSTFLPAELDTRLCDPLD